MSETVKTGINLLTNEQRKCFALPVIEREWDVVALAPSRYDDYNTYICITPDNRVVKVILDGESIYRECSLDEQLTPDRAYILPKTDKGKAVKLTAASIIKKSARSIELYYGKEYINIINNETYHRFYDNVIAGDKIHNKSDFLNWVERWCAETGEKEMADISAFTKLTKRHIKCKAGDFFRFRLDRHLFGYGRIIFNYDDFQKEGNPYWRLFMGKPVLAGVYHIATEDKNVSINRLNTMKMLPPEVIMDNVFYYGEYEIIGNITVDETQIDFPVHYGESLNHQDRFVGYMSGRVFEKRYDVDVLFNSCLNHGVGWRFTFGLPELKECIKQASNDPYWQLVNHYSVRDDLRNPKNQEKLKLIKKQMKV